MAEQSFLAKLGLRFGQLGTSASLALAFPLANGNYDPSCHTDAARIGLYGDRTAGSEKLGVIVGGQTGPLWTRIGTVVNENITGTFTAKSGALVGIALLPQGGAANFTGTITTVLLSADRTYTFPDANASIVGGSLANTQVAVGNASNQISGSAALTANVTSATDQGMIFTASTTDAVFYEAENTNGVASAGFYAFNNVVNHYFQFTQYGSTAPSVVDLGALVPFADLSLIFAGRTNMAIGSFAGKTISLVPGQRLTATFSSSLAGIFTDVQIIPLAVSGGSSSAFTVVGAANTNVVAGAEIPDVQFAIGRTVTWATGAIGTQRAIYIEQPTYAFNGASTITTAATVGIIGAPIAGGNATITNSYALWVQSGRAQFDGIIGMPTTGSATSGVIYAGNKTFIHNYGSLNTFCGINSGNFTMTGQANIGVGENTLQNVTSGSYLVAVGAAALSANTSGLYNIGIGYHTLVLNTSGADNIAIGYLALSSSLVGNRNVAIGSSTLAATTGDDNTAFGYQTMVLNVTGVRNVAIGEFALFSTTADSDNTVVGYNAMGNSASGSNIVAVGGSAMANGTGTGCTALGYGALFLVTGDQNTAVGIGTGGAITTGTNNTFLGASSGSTGTAATITEATAIGFQAQVTASYTIVLGGTGAHTVMVAIGATSAVAQLDITTDSAVTIGEVIRGFAAQTADLQQWRNSADTVLARVKADGSIVFAGGFGPPYATAAGSLVLTSANKNAVYTGTGGHTFTLPAANANGASQSVSLTIKCSPAATGNLTVARAGADTINSSTTGNTSLTLTPGQSVDLNSDGSSLWEVT